MHDDIAERLACGVLAGQGDLDGMGECLNLLDALEARRSAEGLEENTLREVRETLSRLILESSCEPEADWRAVREGIDVLSGAAPPPPGKAPAPECPPPPPAPEDFQMGEDPELLRDFIEEARENLSAVELGMLALEESPENPEAVNAVFRPFHSIKGVAGFLNLNDIHHLSHEVENILDEARAGRLRITRGVIDLVLGAVDVLKGLVSAVEHPGSDAGASARAGAFTERVRQFRAGGPEAPSPRVGDILVASGVVSEEAVERAASLVAGTGVKIGEALVEAGEVASQEVTKALREQAAEREGGGTVRVDTRKLDGLVDMVGELVIAQSMVLQNPDVQAIRGQKFQKDAVQLSRITAELQRISMSMRMVPIRGVFQRMIRLVRDLARKSGKEVVLEMRGEETEIDRNMVEEIYEPLVHMIRNAADHGVEPPDERRAAGKDPKGRLVLSAGQAGGNILIEIADDGRGLDTEKIRRRAIERGIIPEAGDLETRAIHELIFHPGFSTSDVVTEVSGRGVGMDVVKRSVERLRGKMDITSEKGLGTRFQLKFPLTLAIIDGMVIRVGEERYIVPTIALKESLRPERAAYATVHGRGELIRVRDTFMPLVRLHRMFGVRPKTENPWEALLLVVHEGNRGYCLLADEIVGRQEVVIKSLGAGMRGVRGVSGGAILGDGLVALILDVRALVSLHEENSR